MQPAQKKLRPPDKRPRAIDPDARLYPVEAAEIINVSFQRLTRLCQLGELPQIGADGRFPLREFLTAYIKHVESTAHAAGAKEAEQRVRSALLAGL